MTFGSLFAGIGGFDLGLERAGMECRWQVEIDDYASRVLAKHWPHVARWGDVRTFPPDQPSEWSVDLICAGVPCQPVSHAGKQKGAADERWMWGEALRVVADLQPRFFVAENPIGILNHDGGRTFRGLLRALASVGYVCEWHVIAAADVGAPHLRQRVWLVAHANGVSRTEGQPRRACGCLHATCAGSQGRQDEGQARPVSGDCCADVADADCVSGPQQLCDEQRHKGPANAFGSRIFGEGSKANGWWAAEPDVGRAIDGFSSWLDDHKRLTRQSHERIMAYVVRTQGEGDANAKKKSAAEIMRSLRDCFGEENVQRSAGRSVCVSASEVLLTYLRKLEEGLCEEGNASLEGQEDEGSAVRGLRPDDKPSRTSHRPRRNKQHTREYSNTLQDLSRLLALDSQAAWVAYRRSDACPRLNWESGIPRVAHGIPNRVDRLRCLGNAVVPQIVELIGRAIIEAEGAAT